MAQFGFFGLEKPPEKEAANWGGLEACEKHLGYCGIPSTMNERAFVDFARIALTSFCRGELFQACAFSALSKAMMMNRFGAVPSRAVSLADPTRFERATSAFGEQGASRTLSGAGSQSTT
jgi:hypothetical protein